MIGYKPDMKSLGKRSALNAHAAFDEAGAGNTIGWIGAPVLDPTCERLGVKFPLPTRPPYVTTHFKKQQRKLTTLIICAYICTYKCT
jgi:hypothetical protein